MSTHNFKQKQFTKITTQYLPVRHLLLNLFVLQLHTNDVMIYEWSWQLKSFMPSILGNSGSFLSPEHIVFLIRRLISVIMRIYPYFKIALPILAGTFLNYFTVSKVFFVFKTT